MRVGSLFDEPRTNLVRKQDRERASFGGYGVEDAVLTPKWERSLQVIESRVEPGGRSGDEPHHQGRCRADLRAEGIAQRIDRRGPSGSGPATRC